MVESHGGVASVPRLDLNQSSRSLWFVVCFFAALRLHYTRLFLEGLGLSADLHVSRITDPKQELEVGSLLVSLRSFKPVEEGHCLVPPRISVD